MEWIRALRNTVVGLDTAPPICFIEENPDYLETVRPFFETLDGGEIRSVTSTVTLLEVLVHPPQRDDDDLAARYRDILLGARDLTTLPMSGPVAERAARLRAEHSLRTPDAIQIAVAIEEDDSAFLTNDSRLPSVSGLQMLVLDDIRP